MVERKKPVTGGRAEGVYYHSRNTGDYDMLTPLDATQKLIIESLRILQDIAKKKCCKIDDLSDADIDKYFDEYRQRFEV